MQVNLEPELVKEKGKVKQNETMRGLKRRVAQRARAELPEPFAGWFAARGWRPHAHQLRLLDLAGESRDALLIAPTGGGKTLAGFLPSLVDLTGPAATKSLSQPPHALRLALEGARRPTSRATSPSPSRRWVCPSGSRPAPATRRPRAARVNVSCLPIFCSPRPSRSRSCCRTAMRPSCSARSICHPRRAACARLEQARRPARARSRPASHPFARAHGNWPVGDGGAPLGACRLPRRPQGTRAHVPRRDRRGARAGQRRISPSSI